MSSHDTIWNVTKCTTLNAGVMCWGRLLCQTHGIIVPTPGLAMPVCKAAAALEVCLSARSKHVTTRRGGFWLMPLQIYPLFVSRAQPNPGCTLTDLRNRAQILLRRLYKWHRCISRPGSSSCCLCQLLQLGAHHCSQVRAAAAAGAHAVCCQVSQLGGVAGATRVA
jgi:hypothetical protein